MAWMLRSLERSLRLSEGDEDATMASTPSRSVVGEGAEGGTSGWSLPREHSGPRQGATGRGGQSFPGWQPVAGLCRSFFDLTCEPQLDAPAVPEVRSASTTARATGTGPRMDRPGNKCGARTVGFPNIDQRKSVFHSYPGH